MLAITSNRGCTHRSLFNAGFTPEMKKPLVGIISSTTKVCRSHMNLNKIVDAVKLGVTQRPAACRS